MWDQLKKERNILQLSLLRDTGTKVFNSVQATVSVTVSPDRSQFFKHEHFSVSCEDEKAAEGAAGWKVMKRMTDNKVRSWPPPLIIRAAFVATDSGVYWCETEQGATSSHVNITVTDGSVILESPVQPLTEGDNVTLSCRCQKAASACNPAANFYKHGLLVKTSSTGNMPIHFVSPSDQGLYKCEMLGSGDSPESWLTVRAIPAGDNLHNPLLHLSPLVRHLIVGTPYLLSTILMGLVYKDKKRVERERQASQRQTSDDVIMQIST